MRTNQGNLELCIEAIEKANLCLDGLSVLTELGTNEYSFLPIIASMAGASSVTAFVKDSPYGKADAVEAAFYEIQHELGLSLNIQIRKNTISDDEIANADIITNNYMLRPFDRSFLSKLRPGRSVITLMFEAWEFRNDDIDIAAADELGVRICGVSEADREMPIFEFCGPMIAKLAFQAGFEILQNRIVIFSDDNFGAVAKRTFERLGASDIILTCDLGSIPEKLEKADFLLLANYGFKGPILGSMSPASIEYLNRINPNLSILHLFGDISDEYIQKVGRRIFPMAAGRSQVMTRTLAFVGSKPVFWLQAAGLKAAQEVLRNETVRFSQPVNKKI